MYKKNSILPENPVKPAAAIQYENNQLEVYSFAATAQEVGGDYVDVIRQKREPM
jgi:hypothetical protein